MQQGLYILFKDTHFYWQFHEMQNILQEKISKLSFKWVCASFFLFFWGGGAIGGIYMYIHTRLASFVIVLCVDLVYDFILLDKISLWIEADELHRSPAQ